jgi:hypothetical protein
MTAQASGLRPLNATDLFRRHLREMRLYADTLVAVLGEDSPIVKRIRSCAASNEAALEAVLLRTPPPSATLNKCCLHAEIDRAVD